MIRSENAGLAGHVYVDIRDTDLASAVKSQCSALSRRR
jgi:hypothetical protein